MIYNITIQTRNINSDDNMNTGPLEQSIIANLDNAVDVEAIMKMKKFVKCENKSVQKNT